MDQRQGSGYLDPKKKKKPPRRRRVPELLLFLLLTAVLLWSLGSLIVSWTVPNAREERALETARALTGITPLPEADGAGGARRSPQNERTVLWHRKN
ncbi:MAG: hypothetical protein K6F19_02755, partial [Oscillospiraceae bacterium]|nr:hypothetical protein [Oscillospiraceae bacterium]